MTYSSGKNDYNMEWLEENRLQQNDEAVREHPVVITLPGEQISGHSLGGSSRINSTPKRKRDSFLVWVAFTRDRDLSTNEPNETDEDKEMKELQRRKCPLKGCEKSFKDSQTMFQHVPQCPFLLKGSYRCYKCGGEERIGRYQGCPDHFKDRFAKFANSVRLIKGLFHRHAKKQRTQPPQGINVPYPEKFAELDFNPVFELDAIRFDRPTELFGDESFPELGEYDDSLWTSADEVYQQQDLDLSGCNESMQYVPPSNAAAELDTPACSTYISENDNLAAKASGGIAPHQLLNDNRGQLQATSPSASRSLQLNTHSNPERWHQDETYGGTPIDDAVSPLSPTISEHHYGNIPALSPDDNITATDELSLPSESSTAPSLAPSLWSSSSSSATPKSSMSSFDSTVVSGEEHQSSSTPMFGDYGSDMLTSEPEELDSFPILENFNEVPPTYDFNSFPILNKFNKVPLNYDPSALLPDVFIFDQEIMLPAPLFCNASNQQHQHPALPREVDILEAILFQTLNHSPLPSPWSDPHNPTELPTPFKAASPFTPPTPGSKYQCRCGYVPTGKEANKLSNLKRHQKTACPYRLTGVVTVHKCNYPGCTKSYPRRDNLLQHQTRKSHKGSVDLDVRFISMSPSFSEQVYDVAELDGSELRPGGPKRRRTD